MNVFINKASRIALLLAAVLSVATAACSGRNIPPQQNVAVTRGHLLMVGGGPSPREITQRFVELAGGAGKARIAVIPMASSVAATGPEKVAQLKEYGAHAFVVDVTRAGADAEATVRSLDGATGIWFSGGDQNRLTAAIGGTRTEQAIRARFLAGAVVGGTSAGAAVMSDVMITGDERRLGGDRPPTDSSQAFITIERNNIVTARGFGLIGGVIVDQHFVRRRRNNRLMSLILENPSLLGVGIDESTAIDVRPDGTWEVIGQSIVIVFDARKATVTQGGGKLGGSGVRTHVLPAGSTMDPASGRVDLPPGPP